MTNFIKPVMLKISFMEHAYKDIKDEIFEKNEARAIVNEFLLNHLKDGFCAGQPTLVMFAHGRLQLTVSDSPCVDSANSVFIS